MGKRILVVEDDIDIAVAFETTLGLEGYSVSTARNGAEALAHLEYSTNRPDLILLDLRMPVMDGTEFRRRQVSDARFSSIPVIVLSADRNAFGEVRRLGVELCLPKPVDLELLLKKVHELSSGA